MKVKPPPSHQRNTSLKKMETRSGTTARHKASKDCGEPNPEATSETTLKFLILLLRKYSRREDGRIVKSQNARSALRQSLLEMVE